MSKKTSVAAYFYLSLVILIWSTLPAVSKLLLSNLDSFQILFLTTGVASVVFFIIMIFQSKLKIILTYKPKDYLQLFYVGAIGIFLYSLFYFLAFTYLEAHDANSINYLWPVMVIIFAAIILKEKPSIKKIGAVLISFCGVYVAITNGNLLDGLSGIHILGVVFGVLCAISYGLFSVLGKKEHHDLVVAMFFYNLFSFLLSIVTLFLFSSFVFPHGSDWPSIIWIGGFINGIAYLFWFLALKYGDTAKISTLIYITPFLGLIGISILLKENIDFSAIVGLCIIVAGILLQFIDFKKHKEAVKKTKVN